MSRIGNKLIPVVNGCEVTVEDGVVLIKGKNGEDKVSFNKELIGVEVKDGNVHVTRNNEQKHTKQLHGTTRALIQNAIIGCTEGYKKVLEIIGIGYHAEMKGKDVVLSLGYSHPITISPLDGVTIKVIETKNKEINIKANQKIKHYLKNDFDFDDIKYEYEGVKYVTPFTKQGTKLGIIKIIYKGETLDTFDLIYSQKVKLSIFSFLWYYKIIIIIFGFIIFIKLKSNKQKKLRRKRKLK